MKTQKMWFLATFAISFDATSISNYDLSPYENNVMSGLQFALLTDVT